MDHSGNVNRKDLVEMLRGIRAHLNDELATRDRRIRALESTAARQAEMIDALERRAAEAEAARGLRRVA